VDKYAFRVRNSIAISNAPLAMACLDLFFSTHDRIPRRLAAVMDVILSNEIGRHVLLDNGHVATTGTNQNACAKREMWSNGQP